jgi:uncharacterized protein YkwD
VSGRRSRRLTSLIAAAIGVVLVLSACSPQELQVADQINASRSQYGLYHYQLNLTLQIKAHNHAQYMADTGKLVHSNLASGNGYSWRRLGENVGYGPDLNSIHNAFMNSTGHRANILDRGFQYHGTGVVQDRYGRLWVAHEFMQL